MKNRKCPNHKACWDYGSCEDCELGKEIARLHKRIDRLKKQNETLTIQRNAWALAAKAVKEDTVRKMQERLKAKVNADIDRCYMLGFSAAGPLSLFLDEIDEIAKEMIENG